MADSSPFRQPVYVYKGADAALVVTMSPVEDITDHSLIFSVRTAPGDGELLLQKVTPTYVEITDGENGEATVWLLSVDTDQFDIGTYYYDVWRYDSGNRYPIIEPSKFVVYPPVTFTEQP